MGSMNIILRRLISVHCLSYWEISVRLKAKIFCLRFYPVTWCCKETNRLISGDLQLLPEKVTVSFAGSSENNYCRSKW